MNKNLPMKGAESNSPGNFEIISRTNDTIINPGETISIDILITGYGKITESKIVFYPSGAILDVLNSKVYFDLGNKENKLVWGVTEQELKNQSGVTIGLSGAGWQGENWPVRTLFFDLTEGSTPIISTEAIMHDHKPPFQFVLKTKDKIRPGNYDLYFVFTYFNGVEWKASNLTVSFTVRNILQRHEILVAWIAFIATIISIASSIYAIVDFYK